MNSEEMKNKLEALVENEAFVADLKQAESKDDLQNLVYYHFYLVCRKRFLEEMLEVGKAIC